MGLENYRDMSSTQGLNAGFQFEFSCSNCARKWKTPFKPYRTGQVSAFLGRFAFLFGSSQTAGRLAGGAADYSSRGAKAEALAESMPQAERMFSNCVECENGFCEDCLDDRHTCPKCVEKAKRDGVQNGGGGYSGGAAGGQGGGARAAGQACPNCSTANGSGGRFCAECGFDMASTHKSCPACGAMADRTSRFCGDCGHGF